MKCELFPEFVISVFFCPTQLYLNKTLFEFYYRGPSCSHTPKIHAVQHKMAGEWDTSIQSKEQIEASLQNKQDAVIRRERAMAYAFSHQWKNSSRANQMFMDPNNPQWGWSWMECSAAARPWESRSAADTEPPNGVRVTGGAEKAKAYARRDNSIERPSSLSAAQRRLTSRQSLSSPPSKVPSFTRNVKSVSPKEYDTGSFLSMKSGQVNMPTICYYTIE